MFGVSSGPARHSPVTRLSAVALCVGGSLVTSCELLPFDFRLLTSDWQLHLRSHRRKFARAFIETTLKILRNIRVEWIRRQIRRQRAITKMLVHPEPGGGIFPDNRLELVPASLRHFLERSAGGKFNPGMKNHAVTPAGQRLAMDVDE